jgi:hypothetical protein
MKSKTVARHNKGTKEPRDKKNRTLWETGNQTTNGTRERIREGDNVMNPPLLKFSSDLRWKKWTTVKEEI